MIVWQTLKNYKFVKKIKLLHLWDNLRRSYFLNFGWSCLSILPFHGQGKRWIIVVFIMREEKEIPPEKSRPKKDDCHTSIADICMMNMAQERQQSEKKDD
nr:MAG TPA: hypothetical protein [Caudoviricetes sp.]